VECWKQLLMYSGILAKVGAAKAGTGFVWPSPASVSMVLERLQLLSWPLTTLAVILIALSVRTSVLYILSVSSPAESDE